MTDIIHEEITIGEILRKMEARLAVIEAQCIKTNGRVAMLEKWKYGFIVGISTLAVTKWPILVPLLQNMAQVTGVK